MNISTGHMIHADMPPIGYTPIPNEFKDEVMRAFGGNQEAQIDIKSNSPLSTWARQQRKARNKQAKNSRRQNRGQ